MFDLRARQDEVKKGDFDLGEMMSRVRGMQNEVRGRLGNRIKILMECKFAKFKGKLYG